MEKTHKVVAIILAGGTGERFQTSIPKQFVKLSGKMIIEHTVEAFENHPLIDEIFLIIHENFHNVIESLYKSKVSTKVTKILIGGNTRQESSRTGINSCDDKVDKVLIHDAVRPFVSEQLITNAINALDHYLSVDVAIPTGDTIIKVSERNVIDDVPQRKYLLRGQTPQGFQLSVIKHAHFLAEKESYNAAFDDCSLILRYHLGDTYVINGSEYNIKITYPLDLDIADKIFQLNNLTIANINFNAVEKKLPKKVIVVFGGTSGIGLDIVNLCRKYGGYAYGYSRTNGVDVRDSTTVKRSLEEVSQKHSKIDMIISSAGVLKRGFVERVDESDICDQISINLIGSMLVARESIPYLKKTKGSLLFFASSSYSRGRCEYASYSASKAGLVNFVQGFAEEMSMYNVRANVLNPERTDTPLRRKNFGKESPEYLLSSQYVAFAAINVALSNITGAVVDVRKLQENSEVFSVK